MQPTKDNDNPPSKHQQLTKLQELEAEVLRHSGLEPFTELHILNVNIDFHGPNYIHTIKCGNQVKDDLVLVHGFGGCGALFYPILKDLSMNFRVFCIDLLGMGLSSRPEYNYETTEEAIDFFVESIEKWREALGLESFYLAGHSLGGYISTQYSIRYQSRIKKLYLVSPAGITKERQKSEDENQGWISKALQQIMNKIGANKTVMQRIWDENLTPHTLLKRYPIISKYLLRRYVINQYGQNGKETPLVELMIAFLTMMIEQPESSEKAVYYILKTPAGFAHLPLEDIIIEKLHIPVNCYYGDRDWMDWTGADRISKQVETFKLKTINDAGHQVQLQNPKTLSEEIIICM